MAFKKFLKAIAEIVAIAAIGIFAMILCRQFVFNPYAIGGTSMEPSFHDGDYVFVDELTYRFRTPERGDVVVFHGDAPGITGEDLIKRVIGLPGERVVVGSGQVTVFNENNPAGLTLSEDYLGPADPTTGSKDITLGPDKYFVLGDNRPVSFDSRSWGAVDKKSIVGLVRLRIWPPTAAQAFSAPQY